MSTMYPVDSGPVKWITTEWLGKHIKEKKLTIIDTQPNVHDYIFEHIPGAVYMNENLLRVPKNGLPAQYVPAESMQAIIQRLGIKADAALVVYTGKGAVKGWGDGLEQTMVAYSLTRFGHKNIYILDGGLDKWKKEDRPLTKEFPRLDESDFKPEIDDALFIGYEEFKRKKDEAGVIVLDARPAEVYEGQGPWRKPGHIPGAINLPWKELMTSDNTCLLKQDKEINRVIEKRGIDRDKLIICSCGTGREATNEFTLFKWYLGFPHVKIYEGSFTEWTSYPDNPTVTGKSPR
jgi:thiosulfate/3-mercaptopyruvate sulfurtransferase